MSSADLFWWIGVVCFVIGFAWGAWRPKDQPVPGLVYLIGVAGFDLSLIFDPNLSGKDLWVPLILMSAMGLLFVFLSCFQVHFKKKERNDGVEGVQQGQADGQLPEGAGSDA